MAEIKIDKGAPMPKGVRTVENYKYPWAEMEVGDSFLAPKHLKYFKNLVSHPNKRYAPRRFTARKTPEGYRIWRVA
jgi:hypothetical protein